MGYLGLVPSERSTGDSVKRGGITKAGNRRARRVLVEAAWSYRHPPRVGRDKLAPVAAAPEAVRAIAWKAQTRLSARFRALTKRSKLSTIAVVAIARELAGFIWAIGRAMAEPAGTTEAGTAGRSGAACGSPVRASLPSGAMALKAKPSRAREMRGLDRHRT